MIKKKQINAENFWAFSEFFWCKSFEYIGKKEEVIAPSAVILLNRFGNLDDITNRAIEVLSSCDLILAEDTRTTRNLLRHLGVDKPLKSFHLHNEHKAVGSIVDSLTSGLHYALCSDAGTPGISDPGCVLINECLKEGINVSPIPGPSAVSSAVSVSGFSDKFYFYGFLPEKNKLLNSDLQTLSKLNCSIVFFISSKKFNRIIPDLKKNFKGRKIIICKEMTKYYEEFIRKDVDTLETSVSNLKGELTIVISHNKFDKKSSKNLSESDKQLINSMIKKLSIKEIINFINRDNTIPKKEIYNYCVKLKNEK